MVAYSTMSHISIFYSFINFSEMYGEIGEAFTVFCFRPCCPLPGQCPQYEVTILLTYPRIFNGV